MSRYVSSFERVSSDRSRAPPAMLKTFREEEDKLASSDRISRLEARVAVLAAENASLKEERERQKVKVALLKRFCRYHAIKLQIEDELERETNTQAAMLSMKAELDGMSLPLEGAGAASTISGIPQNSPRSNSNDLKGSRPNQDTNHGNTITNSNFGGRNQLKVRFDRRVHGGGVGIDNRFSYGSESISQHKYMGPADGVASPRRANGHGGGDGTAGTDTIGQGNSNASRFRMRKDRTVHGVNNDEAVLMLGSDEYQERLRKQNKKERSGMIDARRRKLRPVNRPDLNIFGGAELPKVSKEQQAETDKLDETLFAGMLNPKQPGSNDHERHGTDLRAETQLMHRQLYRGPQPQRNEIPVFLRR